MAEDKAPAGAPAAKGKLKLIILLVLAVILAVGLSVVGTLWFMGDGLPGMGEAGDADAEQAETFVASEYIILEKALVTTIQAEGRQRYAQAYLAFEADNPQALAATELHMPLLRSQLVSVLGDSDFMELQTPQGREALVEKMLESANRILEGEGEPPLKRVLFRNFVVQ